MERYVWETKLSIYEVIGRMKEVTEHIEWSFTSERINEQMYSFSLYYYGDVRRSPAYSHKSAKGELVDYGNGCKITVEFRFGFFNILKPIMFLMILLAGICASIGGDKGWYIISIITFLMGSTNLAWFVWTWKNRADNREQISLINKAVQVEGRELL